MGKANRLAKSSSPYLLQHAYNPVEWYEWDVQAFERAKKEGKAIFLSIGYSACHWCHVMAHESFEDEEVAAFLNESFISIKVDREERPDIDGVYMEVCQSINGSGGWPLTVILTPEKDPLFAGTYLPKEGRFGRLGLLDLLRKVDVMWREEPEKLRSSAKKLSKTLADSQHCFLGDEGPDPSLLDTAFLRFQGSYDADNGGFGISPKFPCPHNFLFLLRYWRRSSDSRALAMVEESLESLARGGIWDHLGFGFHRYSTDEKWLLPHFEKMLYDQALLIMAYSEAYRHREGDGLRHSKDDGPRHSEGDGLRNSKAKVYRQIVERTVQYCRRQLLDEGGAFYSAEDADSEGEEGKFYLWSLQEIEQALGEDAPLFARVYSLTAGGNFNEEASARPVGRNILHTLKKDLVLDEDELQRLERSRQKLLKIRQRRVRPGVDDKILCDWNALMVIALSRAYRAFGEEQYLQGARDTVDFILEKMKSDDGGVYHRYRQGSVGIEGKLNDYSYLAWALLELYEVSSEESYAKEARHFLNLLVEKFWDEEQQAFDFTPHDGEQLIFKRKESYDGARPSGNSVAFFALEKASRLLSDESWRVYSKGMLKSFGKILRRAPSVHSFFLCGLDLYFGAG